MKQRQFTQHPLIAGTLVLTIAGLFSRLAGFFYRIFLSKQLGAESMGLYQLIFPLYGVCTAICCSSFQTALSRFIAKESEQTDRNRSLTYVLCALFLAMALSLLCAAGLYFFAVPLSVHILAEERCAPLLKMLAFAVPVCAAHSCIIGCYYGLQKTTVPALSQVIEQAVRVSAVFLIYRVNRLRGIPFQVTHAVYGLVIGEIAALLASLFPFGPLWSGWRAGRITDQPAVKRPESDKPGAEKVFSFCMKNLIQLVIPMTANRLCLSLLQSTESILIPARLRLFGLSQSEALGMFGTLSGMALPFILFPSTLIHSLAVMLLPEVAKAQSAGNSRKIQLTSDLSIRLSLMTGILCLGVFRYFGNAIGTVVFGSETAGSFITQLSFLCPFLYLSVTLASIINGLGKTEITFFHSLCSMSVRMAFIFFVMPSVGIAAYFYGLLVSEILLTALHLRYLCRTARLKMNLSENVLKPSFTLIPVCFSASALETFLRIKTGLPELAVYLLAGVWFVFSFSGILLLWRDKSEE